MLTAAAWTPVASRVRARRSLARSDSTTVGPCSQSGRSASSTAEWLRPSNASTPPCAPPSCRSCSAGRTRSSRCSSSRISPRRTWPPPWLADLGRRPCSRTLDAVAATPPPDGLGRLADDPPTGLARRSRRDPSAVPRGSDSCSAAWLDEALPALLASVRSEPARGRTRCSTATCAATTSASGTVEALLVDWNCACVGNPAFDIAFWLPSLTLEGGPATRGDRTRPSGRRHASLRLSPASSPPPAGLPPPVGCPHRSGFPARPARGGAAVGSARARAAGAQASSSAVTPPPRKRPRRVSASWCRRSASTSPWRSSRVERVVVECGVEPGERQRLVEPEAEEHPLARLHVRRRAAPARARGRSPRWSAAR